MTCNCQSVDQMPAEVEEYLAGLDDSQRSLEANTTGTGMFLVPAPEIGILEERVVLVPELSYEECAKRGTNCEAFKWIPNGFMKFDGIEAKLKKCSRYYCGPNRKWCPWFCFCGRGNYCR